MDEISKALPDLVWLTPLDVSGTRSPWRGKTLSPNAVATYLENLKKSPFFAEPVFKSLGQEPGSQGPYSWEMTLTFKPAAVLASRPRAPSRSRPPPVPEKKGRGLDLPWPSNCGSKIASGAVALGFGLAFGIALAGAVHYAWLRGLNEEIKAKRTELEGLQQEIQKGARPSASSPSSGKRSSGWSSSSPSCSRSFRPSATRKS